MAIELPSGKSISVALAADPVVLLERGGTYQSFSIERNNVKIGVYGDTSKPAPRVLGRINDVVGRTGITVQGIVFEGQDADTAGLKFFNCNAVDLDGIHVRYYGGMGVTNECYGNDSTGKPKRSKGFKIRNSIIEGNWNRGSGHVSGMFISYTDDIEILRNVFTGNGWKEGTTNGTEYNHNVYIHASNGPARVEGNLFHKGSSHGVQMRSGGICRYNLFVDNAIHNSYGLAHGSPVFPGGVSGVVENNVYIGGKAIGTSKRGWCLEISQAKKVLVRKLLMAHDNQNNAKALQTLECQRVENPEGVLPPSQWDLRIEDVYIWDWPPGDYSLTVGSPDLKNVGTNPPTQANLRTVIGDFLTRARKNPDNIKTMVLECFTAVGVDPAIDSDIPIVVKPPIPSNFRIIPEATRLNFRWDELPNAGTATTYRVYKDNVFLLGSTDGNAYAPKVDGEYYVVSVYKNVESDPSVKRTYPEQGPTKPPAPKNVNVVLDGERLRITWLPVSTASRYVVYRNDVEIGASSDTLHFYNDLSSATYKVACIVNNIKSDLSVGFDYKSPEPQVPKITSVAIKYDIQEDKVISGDIETVTIKFRDGTEQIVK